MSTLWSFCQGLKFELTLQIYHFIIQKNKISVKKNRKIIENNSIPYFTTHIPWLLASKRKKIICKVHKKRLHVEAFTFLLLFLIILNSATLLQI